MPSDIKILLVDDNRMVLRQALAYFRSVQTISDGTDALVKAIDETPVYPRCRTQRA